MSTTARLLHEVVTLLAAHGPATAYRLRLLTEEKWGRAISPPLVYRALERLLSDGSVTRLPATRRFALCATTAEVKIVLSCERCGGVIMDEDARLAAGVRRLANRYGFRPRLGSVELLGRCMACL